jgi:hypothetical protein
MSWCRAFILVSVRILCNAGHARSGLWIDIGESFSFAIRKNVSGKIREVFQMVQFLIEA